MSSDGFERRPVIAIWGVGLIGGSLGMAWRRAGVASKVIGIGRSPLDEAVRLGAIDGYTADPAAALAEADLVVLCAPVRTIIRQAAEYAAFVKPGAVVTDVGSTKAEIVAAWESRLPEGAAFVGGHPMFGREVSGVANASPDLPRGCRWVLTPGRCATAEAVATLTRLAEATGAAVLIMAPQEHDQRVAVASHLPQLVATALAAGALEADRRAGGGVLDLAATGFRDTTRLASSPADLWTDILLTNQPNISAALATFRQALRELERAVELGDADAIERLFARAQETRRRLQR
jgi:prephenate dehydrogenase